jgi:hypothetical protein
MLGCAAAGLLTFAPTSVHAQEKREATYRATLAGLSIGTGTVTLDIGRNRYSLSGTGKTLGLMQALAGGSGEAAAQGTVHGSRLASTAYGHTIRSSRKVQSVRMGLLAGSVKQLAVEPPAKPESDLVPLTDANRRGVTDPLSAALIPAAGQGGVAAEACAHKLPIFDGRLRFDLALSYKRHESVHAEGYEGQAVVCGVAFQPIAGYRKDKFSIKYLRESRNIEIWFAPVAGTPFLAVYRVSVPTVLGPGVLQATRFFVAPARARVDGADTRAR